MKNKSRSIQSTCKHCGKPIRMVRTEIGQVWMHFDPELERRVVGYFCKMTHAEPVEKKPRPKVMRGKKGNGRTPPEPMPPKIRTVEGFGI